MSARPESLIERAARVYDFNAHLRGRADAPVEAVAVEEPLAARVQDAAQPAAAPTGTLAAIPAEFLSYSDDDGLDEWIAPPSDVAMIDRTMLA